MIVFTTNRLILREFDVTDAKTMFDLNSDEEVLKYTGDKQFDSLDEAKKFFENYPDYEQNGFGRWAVVLRENKETIGWCGLKKNTDETIDLGYRFFKKEWNKGYATEAAKACLDFGFEVLEMPEIVANSDKNNGGSIRVMEKIGMKFDQELNHDGIENAVRYKLTLPNQQE